VPKSALPATNLSHLASKLRLINLCIGHSIAWLTFFIVIITSIVVVQRYWFADGSIRLQESISFMHAAVFMLAAAYTLAAGDHVRVDIFYSRMSPRNKAWVDLLGTAFLLLPFCIFLIWTSWDYVSTSWVIEESSPEAGGLPYPFPTIMKSFIPIAGALLIIQGLAISLEALQVLRLPNPTDPLDPSAQRAQQG
jgi:TRAP-type mannitol/chloroaromatic compound transport system permease small subunit